MNLYSENFFDIIRKRDIQRLQKYINNQGNVNVKDEAGSTALHYVASKYINEFTENDFAIIKLLLDSGYDVNLKDSHGNTALWTACHSSKGIDFSLVEILMNYHFDVNSINKYGKSPLKLAQERGYKELVKILINQK